MKFISNDDIYADVLSTAMISTIPFISIGILDHPIVLYVSSALGIIFLYIFLIRFFLNLKNSSTIRTSERIADLASFFQLPYVVALSSLILINDGIDMTIGLWLSLIIAIGGTAFIFFDRDD